MLINYFHFIFNAMVERHRTPKFALLNYFEILLLIYYCYFVVAIVIVVIIFSLKIPFVIKCSVLHFELEMKQSISFEICMALMAMYVHTHKSTYEKYLDNK